MNKIRLEIDDYIFEDLNIKVSFRDFIRGKSSKNNPPHSHDYYEMEIITSGGIEQEINGKKYTLGEGSLVLLSPSDFHKYIDVTDNSAHIINLTFLSKVIEYNPFVASVLSGNFVVQNISEESINTIIFLLKKMYTETQNDDNLKKRYISYLMSCLIIEIKRIIDADKKNGDDFENESVRKALAYIRSNFKEQISLEDIAKIMNVSKIYASKLIQDSLGYGFKEYLMNIRLEYAASLLLYTEENISDIAYYSGYNSISYFSRGFKNKFGVSPADYRKNRK